MYGDILNNILIWNLEYPRRSMSLRWAITAVPLPALEDGSRGVLEGNDYTGGYLIGR